MARTVESKAVHAGGCGNAIEPMRVILLSIFVLSSSSAVGIQESRRQLDGSHHGATTGNWEHMQRTEERSATGLLADSGIIFSGLRFSSMFPSCSFSSFTSFNKELYSVRKMRGHLNSALKGHQNILSKAFLQVSGVDIPYSVFLKASSYVHLLEEDLNGFYRSHLFLMQIFQTCSRELVHFGMAQHDNLKEKPWKPELSTHGYGRPGSYLHRKCFHDAGGQDGDTHRAVPLDSGNRLKSLNWGEREENDAMVTESTAAAQI